MRLLACVAFALTTSIVVSADEFKLEPGFKLLFNGKNLDGWQNKMTKKDAKPELLEGKTEAFGGRFKVKDGGELVLDPKVKGDRYIETTQEFSGNVTVRFQFKPGDACNNDLFLLGTKFDITKEGVKNAKFDEWNDFEIAVKDGKAEFKCNGQSIKTIPTKGEKSTFCFRAEFGNIVYRNVRASEGK
jgi:hypothetical protein